MPKTSIPPEAIGALNQRAIPYLLDLIFEFYETEEAPGELSPENAWWVIPKGNFKISLTTGAVRQLEPDVMLGGDPIELWRNAHRSYHFKQAFEAFTRWVENKETGLEPDPEPEEPEERENDPDHLVQAMVAAAMFGWQSTADGLVVDRSEPVIRASALKIFRAVRELYGEEECGKYQHLQYASNFRYLIHAWATGWDLKFFTVTEHRYEKRLDYTLTLLPE